MNKPLTKERRWEINGVLKCAETIHKPALVAALGAEAFWREKLKDSLSWIETATGLDDAPCEWMCQWCRAESTDIESENRQHGPDCPWVLAQE